MIEKKFTREVNKATYLIVILFSFLLFVKNKKSAPGGFSDLFKDSIKTKLKQNKDITIKGLIKISKLIK